jgi:hypothetical protein
VEVISINGSSAKIEIDSQPYTVTVGSTPAPGYVVTAIGGGKISLSHAGAVHSLANGELQTF